MKSKRKMVKKYQLPNKTEFIMIIIFLTIIWFGWGQFQL